MSARETDLIIRLLKQSILTVCREAVSYDSRLEVDGIICLSLENDSRQIVVKVHELFQKHNSSRLSQEGIYYTRPQHQEIFSQNVLRQNDWNRSVNTEVHGSHLDLGSPENSNCSIEILAAAASLKRKQNVEELESPYSKRFAQQGSFECKFKPQKISHAVIAANQVRAVAQCRGQQEKFHGHDKVSSDKDVMSGIYEKHLPWSQEKTVESSLNVDITTELETSTSRMKFYCKCCDVLLISFSALDKHNRQLHACYTCERCFDKFPNLKSSQNHVCQQEGHCSPSQDKCEQKPDFSCDQIDLVMCDGDEFTSKVQSKHNYATESSTMMLLSRSSSGVPPLCEKYNSEVRNFQCGICSFNDTSSLKLRKHFLIHEDPPKVFACENCESQFSDPFVYMTHLHDHSDESGAIFSCCFCNKMFDSFEKMKGHEAIHAENSYHICSKCSKCFLYKSHLNDHMLIHGDCENGDLLKNKTIYPISSQNLCTECQQNFGSESLLREHIYYVHEKNIVIKQPEIFSNENSMESKTIQKEIEHGGHVERCYLATQNHVDNDKISRSLEDDQSSSESELVIDDERISNHTSPVYEKSQSDKLIQNGDTQITDFSQNLSNGAHTTAKTSYVLPTVEINTDTDKCSFIKEELITDDESSESVKNTKNVRNNDFPKQIDKMIFCGNGSSGFIALKKYLNHSSDVQQHRESLLSQGCLQGVKSPMPDKSTLIKVKSAAFERVITPSVAYRTKVPFSCSECDLVFQDFETFDSHSVALHRKFICEYCGKVFTAKPNRERHVRYHTGERPYKCELCMQSFHRGDDLKYHRTTKHSDIKPFTCNICKLSFSWPKDLERHYRTHPMQLQSIVD